MTEHDEPTKDDLIADAEARGLATSGSKAELKDRLDDADGKASYVPDASMVDANLDAQQTAANAQAHAQAKNWT